jgi:hypothetical protein
MSNSTLIYGLATLGSGVLGLSIRYCFKSKCEDVSLCFGLIKIHRDTDSEVKAEEIEIKNGIQKTESMKNLNDNNI